MPDTASADSAHATIRRRFLTFHIEKHLYALPVEDVSEVIPVPQVARVPQGPKSLLGIANLRGSVLPLASLRGLLGREDCGALPESRALVLSGVNPVAIAVDAVQALISVAAERVETRQSELAAEPGERLQGAFTVESSGTVAKILDIHTLLTAAFKQRAKVRRQGGVPAVRHAVEQSVGRRIVRQRMVTFDVAGQEYALSLDAVREIVPAPKALTIVPHSESIVLGLAAYRDTLLPLLALRGLLGLTMATEASGSEKVIVMGVAGSLVGLLVDHMRDVMPAEADLIEPVPPVLAARSGGEAVIRAIYRGESGRRLISILAPEQLFREDVMKRLQSDTMGARPMDVNETQRGMLQYVVFRVGDEEFGLPIDAVDEVSQVPAQITRVPKTPKFLEGVVNLRGEVLPVVDQRRRFGMPQLEDKTRRRLVVVRTERHRAGLIVDRVSEILRAQPDDIQPPPDLTDDMSRLVHGVINLEKAGRMVLILEPGELLSRAERGLLDAFGAAVGQASV